GRGRALCQRSIAAMVALHTRAIRSDRRPGPAESHRCAERARTYRLWRAVLQCPVYRALVKQSHLADPGVASTRCAGHHVLQLVSGASAGDSTARDMAANQPTRSVADNRFLRATDHVPDRAADRLRAVHHSGTSYTRATRWQHTHAPT